MLLPYFLTDPELRLIKAIRAEAPTGRFVVADTWTGDCFITYEQIIASDAQVQALIAAALKYPGPDE